MEAKKDRERYRRLMESSPESLRKFKRIKQLHRDTWDDTKPIGYNATHNYVHKPKPDFGFEDKPKSFAKVNRIQKEQSENNVRSTYPKNFSSNGSFKRIDWSKRDRWDPKQIENQTKSLSDERERKNHLRYQSEYVRSYYSKPMVNKSLSKPIWCPCRKEAFSSKVKRLEFFKETTVIIAHSLLVTFFVGHLRPEIRSS